MIRITVEDTATGEVTTAEVDFDEYLILAGRWSMVAYLPSGRHVARNGEIRLGYETLSERRQQAAYGVPVGEDPTVLPEHLRGRLD